MGMLWRCPALHCLPQRKGLCLALRGRWQCLSSRRPLVSHSRLRGRPRSTPAVCSARAGVGSGLFPKPRARHAQGMPRGCTLGDLGRQIREGKREPKPSLPTFSFGQEKDKNTPRPVSFRVKETVCPRTTRQVPEQCDFKENGVSLRTRVWGCWRAPPKMLTKKPPQNISRHEGEPGGYGTGFQFDLEPPLFSW